MLGSCLASECEESSRVLDQFWGELKKVEQILQKQTSTSAPVTQPDVQNLKMALSSITSGTESENVPDISSRAAAKTVKKKGQKSKNHPRNCIEKGPTKKQRVHSEEPAVVQYGFTDAPPAHSGNSMYQGLEAPPNMSEMGSQTPAYKAYMGTDFSKSMGTINYEGMRPGSSLGFILLPSEELGFVPCACHTSQASNDSQHSQIRCGTIHKVAMLAAIATSTSTAIAIASAASMPKTTTAAATTSSSTAASSTATAHATT
ncbi:hypothetical protein ZWY2020_007008 [Hordeum vulgare]|nr:hypothetical protein ZWY2020_007008 [Hordeum vulgare]